MHRCSLALLLIAGAGCSFDRAGVPTEIADAFVDPGDDGGGIPQRWRDDTAGDFSVGDLTGDAVVEPWGAIGPAAWLTGGLRARASNEVLFTDPDVATWAMLEVAPPAGLGFDELQPTDYGSNRPRNLGLDSNDSYTIWYDGEIWLDPGEHTWSLTVDDVGFVELAAPGSTAFTRVVGATAAAPMNATYDATTAGWHGVRIAFADNSLGAELSVRLQAPGGVAPAPIPRERLRFRADALTGLHWLGFDDGKLCAPRLGPFLFADDGFDYAPSNGEITTLGFVEADRWSMRWSGQVRIDVAGAYAFRLDTDDGQRLWIDGVSRLDAWLDAPQDQTTEAIELDVGWHDLVVDLTDDTGGQDIRLRVDAGPELAGDELPVARLRPVPPRHERTAAAVGEPTTIADDAIAEVKLPIEAPADAAATAVEVSYTISHTAWQDLEIKVVSPDGAEYVLVAAGSSTASGTFTERHTVAVPGATVAGGWLLVVSDNEALDLGTITASALTVRHRGGAPPIAALAAYQSPVEELGAVVGFDGISWAGRLPPGAAVAVRLRTCDAIGGCAAEPWSEPVTTSGDRPSVLARRFAQYRIELTSDGDVAPWLDWIEIAYRGAR